MTNKINKDQLDKALKAEAKLKEALCLLKELQAETNGSIKNTFSHFENEVKNLLINDNGECGFIPFLSKIG